MKEEKPDIIAQRTEEVNDIIDRMPHRTGKIVTVGVAFFAGLLILFGFVIKYPESVTGVATPGFSQHPCLSLQSWGNKVRMPRPVLLMDTSGAMQFFLTIIVFAIESLFLEQKSFNQKLLYYRLYLCINLMIYNANKYLVVVFIFMILFSSCSQKQIRNNQTNFDYTNTIGFEQSHGTKVRWNTNITDDYLSYDRRHFTEGISSLKICNKKKKLPFSTSVFNYFALPESTNQLHINIDCKTENIKTAKFKTIYFDSFENIKGSVSISILNEGEWSTFNLKLEDEDIRNVYIEFMVESNTDNKTIKQANFDNIQIFCNLIKNDSTYEQVEINTSDYEMVKFPLNEQTLNNILDLKTHKIISIGESVHGSLEFQKATYEIIKYQIQQNNCCLILFEMPCNLGFAVNNYISGICDYEIEKIITQVTLDTTELKLFIEWLKAYNSLHNDKVVFVGTDMIFGFAKDDYFPEYLEYLKKNNLSINGIISLIAEKKYHVAQMILSENNSLNDEDKTLISLGLQGLITVENKSFQYNEMRDQFMFIISKLAINGLLREHETAVLYSHLMHTNILNSYKSRLYYPNLGSLLVKEFGNRYYTIALLAGRGTIANNTTLSGKAPLRSPIEGSIEKFCDDNFDCDFYFRINKKIPSCTGRIMGFNYKTDQFYPNSAHNRYDAFIFFMQSNAYNINALTNH